MHIDDITELKSALRWRSDIDSFLSRMVTRIAIANKRCRDVTIEAAEAEDVFPALVAAWEFAKEHAHEIQ